MVLLQNPRGLHHYSPSGFAIRHCMSSHHWHLQYHNTCWIILPKWWGYLHCSVDLTTQSWQLSMSVYGIVSVGLVCVASRTQRSLTGTVSSFAAANARHGNFLLLWRGYFVMLLTTGPLKNFTEVSNPLFFIGYISNPLEHCILSRP